MILIMTTNAGARDLADRRMGFREQGQGGSSRGALERTFTPEFRNRLDAIVNFNALGTAEIERVVDKHLDELRVMVAPKGVRIDITPEARAWLATKGFDRAFGARPMARLIERDMLNGLGRFSERATMMRPNTTTAPRRSARSASDTAPEASSPTVAPRCRSRPSAASTAARRCTPES